MWKSIDIKNKRFGFWVAIDKVGKNKSGQTLWLCQCECGIQKNVTLNSLRTGNSTSCGCNKTPNLVGQVFGKLTVISLNKTVGKTRRYWNCKCICGKTIVVCTYKLRSGAIKSCGCDKADEKVEEDKTPNDFDQVTFVNNHIISCIENMRLINECYKQIQKNINKSKKLLKIEIKDPFNMDLKDPSGS